MPDTRGDVLCPTCGRWTPPAPFCNECGAALQGGSPGSVGGQGSDVFRRGHEVDEPGAPWSSQAERFEPEPEDQVARAAAAGTAGATPIDRLAESGAAAPEPSWPTGPGLSGAAAPPPGEPKPEEATATETPAATKAAAAAALAAAAAAPAAGAPDPTAAAPAAATSRRRSRASTPPPVDEPALPPPVIPPPPPSAPRPADSNGGVSGVVFVAFLGIGILALLGGAIVGGVFDGPVAEASPSPTAIVATPSPEPTPETSSAEASPTTSTAPTPLPSNAQPAAFPDGFLARAEACDEQPTSETCGNSGAVNDGELWILVSFRHAVPSDVIGVRIFDIGGDVEGESSLDLSFCGTNTDCAGYTFFGFNNLGTGAYTVRVDRNGTLAATTSFTVE